MNTTDAPHVDWNVALETVGGSESLLVELIEIFFQEYPKLINTIRESIESSSFKDLHRAAHTLKGSLRYFGDTEAGRIAYELEKLGREEDLTGTVELYEQLVPAAEPLLPELRDYVDRHRSGAEQ